MEKPDIEKMKTERDVDGLIRVLRTSHPLLVDVNTRFNAISALAEIKDKRAVEPLIEAVYGDPDGGLRLRAIWALGEIKDERAVEPLIRKLGEIEAFWRPNVIYALGEIGDERATEHLKRHLADSDIRVRIAANEALEKISQKKRGVENSGRHLHV